MANQANSPMHPEPLEARLARAPRCQARTRAGTECRSLAVKGKLRRRMHGGKGSGASEGNRNAWKHGASSGETLEALAMIRDLGWMMDGLE